ncbi:type 1 glutamine amidotransferase domain-containing protein [Actinacidiphila acididurans]|uniref:Type 1 glutamine amidotransferase domain-containing protein n=1 Tax=Actinacidiphila acididurans TaxID=2784346 RepID=A0ABS2TU09_9ACTN|nr:type 1 glutamine amidotransferase domain-containing protein [Actinacidiphila acididurans]MBM9506562.1 type 1 glutamine amidotransferase domain-containing protein [Actinacidiphila acididurans]
MPSLLVILTGATRWTQKDGSQRPTGFWSEEFVEPHKAFTAAGVELTVVTPGGRPAVVDELSLTAQANGGDEAKVAELRSYLDGVRDLLAHPGRLEDADPAAYDGVFIPGGHGPMQDLAVNEDVARVLETLLPDPSKVVASLCHGQAAFLAAGDADGQWLFKGRRMTSFTDEEETQTGLAANAPWLLATRLTAAGADFVPAAAWSSHVIVDGNLVTGQNPASAAEAAQAVLKELTDRAGAAAA